MKIATAMPGMRECPFCEKIAGFCGKTGLFQQMLVVLGDWCVSGF
jgi:hypothetical protein